MRAAVEGRVGGVLGFAAGHGSWSPIVWGQRYATMSIGELLYGTDTARDIICALVAEMQFRQWHTACMDWILCPIFFFFCTRAVDQSHAK